VSETPLLVWTVHLARRRPRRAAAVVTVILVGAFAAALGFQSIPLGFLAALLLVASVSDFLLPITYKLGNEGISARGLWHRRHLSWEQVRRVVQDDLGVKLSPLSRPSRLEAYRGIYVWFSLGDADQVMATIAYYTSAEAAGAGDRPPVQLITRAP